MVGLRRVIVDKNLEKQLNQLADTMNRIAIANRKTKKYLEQKKIKYLNK